MHDSAGCGWGQNWGGKRGGTARKPLTVVQLKAKARQASKLAEIRKALIAAGYDTTAKQALALGISRSTAWVVLNRDNRAGGSAMKVNRNEARTESINIRVRPSIKRMAVAMAKAEERSLSIFISRLIEAEAKRTGNTTEKR